MARHRSRRRRTGADLSRGLVGVLGLGPLAAIGYLQRLPSDDRTLLAVAVAIVLLCGAGALLMFRLHLRMRRALAWRRALRHWSKNVKPGGTPTFGSAGQLLPRELERFAAQVYAQMGYRVMHTGRTGDLGADVKLVNRQGRLELVQCKQLDRPVTEPEVRDFYGAMGHVGAVQGFLWAPAGFTPAAIRWVKDKPIVLADSREIKHLVESAY